jgi:hypothetical protein
MKRLRILSVIAIMLFSSGLLTSELRAKSLGTFRGEVVKPPQGESSGAQLYLMGPDGNVRRVIVARAAVVYAESVPTEARLKPARRALTPGAEVRVTALVDAKSGEWTASRVEVIAQHDADPEADKAAEDEPATDEITTPRETVVASRTI